MWKTIASNINMIKNSSSLSSYFPHHKKHNSFKIFWDTIAWTFKYGERNDYYFLYGMDRSGGPKSRDFIRYQDHILSLKKTITGNSIAENLIHLLNDKLKFNQLAERLGHPCPKIIAKIIDNQIQSAMKPDIIPVSDLPMIIGNKEVIFKPFTGHKGDGIFAVSSSNNKLFLNDSEISFTTLLKRISGNYLIEERLKQHETLSRLHTSSLNTVRMITAIKNNRARPVMATLRIGTGGQIVDNWKYGGILTGIDIVSGRLTSPAFPYPGTGPVLTSHPDSGIELDGFLLPDFDLIKKSACRFHDDLPELKSVGWDIAVTDKGPCFIEANALWGIRTHYLVEPDFKEKYDECL